MLQEGIRGKFSLVHMLQAVKGGVNARIITGGSSISITSLLFKAVLLLNNWWADLNQWTE